MSTLKEKAQQILAEKQAKIKAQNIKENIQIFDVTGNLPIINNEDKSITENGTYTAGTGYTGLGTVSVNVPSGGDVKLFETIQEMQADPTAVVGEKAVVYRNSLIGITSGCTSRKIICPTSITFDTAVTETAQGTFKGSSVRPSVNIQVTTSRVQISITTSTATSKTITYNTTDQITYTTTSSYAGTEFDLGKDLTFTVKSGTWSDLFSKCILVQSDIFEGLFSSEFDTNIVQLLNTNALTISDIDLSAKTMTAVLDNSEVYRNPIKINKTKLFSILEANGITATSAYCFINSSNELIYTSRLSDIYGPNGLLLGYTLNSSRSSASADFYKIDLENETMTLAYTKSASVHFYTTSTSDIYYLPASQLDCVIIPASIQKNSDSNSASRMVQVVGTSSSAPYDIYQYVYYNYQSNTLIHVLAPTQFSLNNSNQLLPDKVAFGQTGVITGDETFYDNDFGYSIFENTCGIQDITSLPASIVVNPVVKKTPSYQTFRTKLTTFNDRFDSILVDYENRETATITCGDVFYSAGSYSYRYFKDDLMHNIVSSSSDDKYRLMINNLVGDNYYRYIEDFGTTSIHYPFSCIYNNIFYLAYMTALDNKIYIFTIVNGIKTSYYTLTGSLSYIKPINIIGNYLYYSESTSLGSTTATENIYRLDLLTKNKSLISSLTNVYNATWNTIELYDGYHIFVSGASASTGIYDIIIDKTDYTTSVLNYKSTDFTNYSIKYISGFYYNDKLHLINSNKSQIYEINGTTATLVLTGINNPYGYTKFTCQPEKNGLVYYRYLKNTTAGEMLSNNLSIFSETINSNSVTLVSSTKVVTLKSYADTELQYNIYTCKFLQEVSDNEIADRIFIPSTKDQKNTDNLYYIYNLAGSIY